MQNYETIFVAPADIQPQRLDDFVEKLRGVIAKQGGEITAVDKWGRRRLAYPIKRHREGFYVFLTFKSPTAILAELTQFYRVSEDIIRHLTVKAVDAKPMPGSLAGPAGSAAAPHFSPSRGPQSAQGAHAPHPGAPHAPAVPHAAPAPAAQSAAPQAPKEAPHAQPNPAAPAQ